ncbi:hypothetical protein HPB49_015922 [Dermacentor silvarum]|uniref:Uncharacterized protein n=1 Tax=Dermacentor silvarum TaxID=543639 RepID=A0ACB8DE53_DERSI|nr:hypothetical protein HPB49_015922 [Dermacentor silvarum]
MGSGISPPPPFLVSPGTPAIPWPRWLRLFENFTLASGASELSAARRRALLLHCLGPEGQRIFDALPPPPPSNAPDHPPRIRTVTGEMYHRRLGSLRLLVRIKRRKRVPLINLRLPHALYHYPCRRAHHSRKVRNRIPWLQALARWSAVYR